MMEKSNFNQPQKQSIIGIVVLFADTFQSIVRAIIPLIAVWIFKFDQINKFYLTLGILAVITIVAVIAYLQYINFTFYIDDENDEFIINKGVFNKTKIAIQLNKIQQVNINQTLIQRIIGVHALDVDTAGSSNKEVKIRAISHALAVSLKAKLLENASSVIDAMKKSITILQMTLYLGCVLNVIDWCSKINSFTSFLNEIILLHTCSI